MFGLQACSQRRQVGQASSVEIGVDQVGQLGFAGAFMGERKQSDHDLAGAPLLTLLAQRFEGSRIGRPRKQLVPVDQIEQRHRLLAQGVDDMAVVDDMAALAFRHGPAAPQRGDQHGAEEAIEPVVTDAHPRAMADQPRRHGVEHAPQDEAAAGCGSNELFLEVGGAPPGQSYHGQRSRAMRLRLLALRRPTISSTKAR